MGMISLWILAFCMLQDSESPNEISQKHLVIATASIQDMRVAEWMVADLKQRQLLDNSWHIRGIQLLSKDPHGWQAWVEEADADLTIVLGVPGVLAAADEGFDLEKPVIGGFFHDPALFGLRYTELGRSGKAHLNFVVPAPRLQAELQRFAGLLPGSSLAVVLSGELGSAFPDMAERVETIGKSMGLALTMIEADGSELERLAQAQAHLDGVLLGPLFHFSNEARQELIQAITEMSLPTYAMAGLEDVAQGAFAGSVANPRQKLAKRLADHIAAFTQGHPLDQLPAYLPLRDSLTINGETALVLEYPLTLDSRINADIQFKTDEQTQPSLSFAQVIELGLANNPELQAQKQTEKAAHFQKKAALGSWLPQVNAESQITRNNDDNPLIAAGLSAETQTQLVFSGKQLIFDEATLAQTHIAKWEWQQQTAKLNQATQDTLQAVAFAYLNLGIERQLLEVELENLKLTRSNLQVTKTRVQLGAAGLEEQLRWESLEALQLGQVHASQAKWQAARASLERLVGKPVTLSWYERPLRLQAEDSLFLSDAWQRLLDQAGQGLIPVLTEMAAVRSPRIQSSNLQTKMMRRRYTQSKRSFFLPSVSLNASITDVLDQEFQPRTGDGPGFSLQQDGLNWNVTLQASIPLFNGGRRLQQLGAARANHRGAQHLLRASKLASEERVRKALATFRASQPNVALTRLAADRAKQSLDIVLDKYEQGVASILDIQQAQEQAMGQQRQAAIAEYNHVANLVELQTSLSFFDWQLSPEARRQWLAALEQKVMNSGNAKVNEERQP